MKKKKFKTNCRSDGGLDVGLIDSFMTIASVLRSWGIDEYQPAREALKDLAANEDVAWLIQQAKDAEKGKVVFNQT